MMHPAFSVMDILRPITMKKSGYSNGNCKWSFWALGIMAVIVVKVVTMSFDRSPGNSIFGNSAPRKFRTNGLVLYLGNNKF